MNMKCQAKKDIIPQLSFTLFSLIFLSLSLSAADVYKWTDESGHIHYSDIKPANISAENLHIKTSKGQKSISSPQKLASALDERKQKALQKQADSLQQNGIKKQNEAKCDIIRANLKKFEVNSRIRIEEDGKLRYLSPDEISKKKTEYQQQVAEFCS